MKVCSRCQRNVEILVYIYGQRVCPPCATEIIFQDVAALEARLSGQA